MKLLIITQKVNKDDQVLGFFHRWIIEFSKNVESVKVICLEKGSFDLPKNVEVFSLGKENGAGKIKRVFNFYKYIFKLRNDYDVVFVHMNQIYVLLGGLVWRILRKKISLWYAHGAVSKTLKIAEKLTNIIFTSTPAGFVLRSKKMKVVGQGIDTNLFKPCDNNKNKNRIITVGRISEVKNIEKIVSLVSGLEDFNLDIVGAPIRNRDFDYAQKIYLGVKEKKLSDKIIFSGPITQDELPEKYNEANIFINLSKTGSLDKAILEAMSCGLHVVTTNVAAKNLTGATYLSSYEIESNKSILADKIKEVSKLGLNNNARDFVVANHGISSLIKKIVNGLKN
jgi:glycosyltransferase involved in cell wall biosynthesis